MNLPRSNRRARFTYRCSVHCPLDDLPEIRSAIEPDGRLYATLCEFQTQELIPEGEDASAIIGVVGSHAGFSIEARLNKAPLKEELMAGWLERLIGHPVVCTRRCPPSSSGLLKQAVSFVLVASPLDVRAESTSRGFARCGLPGMKRVSARWGRRVRRSTCLSSLRTSSLPIQIFIEQTS